MGQPLPVDPVIASIIVSQVRGLEEGGLSPPAAVRGGATFQPLLSSLSTGFARDEFLNVDD
jgi:hypothetical protein